MVRAIRGNIASGPAQITPLSREVVVLRRLNMRKLPVGVRTMLAEEQLEPGISESEMPWFEDGYVVNDHPRSVELNKFVMKSTVKNAAFAVARTDTGDIVKEFEELEAADRAVRNARTQLDLSIEIPDAEVDEENLEDE